MKSQYASFDEQEARQKLHSKGRSNANLNLLKWVYPKTTLAGPGQSAWYFIS